MSRRSFLMGPAAIVGAAALHGCASRPVAATPASAPVARGATVPSTPGAAAWGIPNFFEIGDAVVFGPGRPTVDTSRWLDALLAPESGTSERDLDRPTRRAFVYSEPDATGGTFRRLALVLPVARPYSANGLAVAHWEAPASAFDFGLDGTRTFGSLSMADGGASSAAPRLRSRFTSSSINAQYAEHVYDVEGSPLSLYESKGLVPGLPVSFERFVLYDRTRVRDDEEPVPIEPRLRPSGITMGVCPSGPSPWRVLESLEIRGYRVLYLEDRAGGRYFLAAPSASPPTWSFGGVGTDLVSEGAIPDALTHAVDQRAASLTLRDTSSGTALFGRVNAEEEIGPDLDAAAAYLRRCDADLASLRSVEKTTFLSDYAHTLLASHRSRRDPRLVTEVPFGDGYYPRDAERASANTWFGTDQAHVILSLVAYYQKTRDRSVLGSIEGLVDASTEAMTPSGSVWTRRFDEMLVATEVDPRTGRADAFIDNGGVSVAFNHQNLVIRRGYDRAPGVTYGAFAPVIDGTSSPVDDGTYRLAIDAVSVPQTFTTDQESLSIARLFARSDGAVRIRETAELLRGMPFAKIQDAIENSGRAEERIDRVDVNLAEFLHYGDGINDIAQNRYGFSRVADGVALPVGFWMDGMPAPLWGDDFPAGWVDMTALYKKYRPRFISVFGYDKAQLYYLPREPDGLMLYNASDSPSTSASAAGAAPAPAPEARPAPATDASKDGYTGWTTLRARYDVSDSLAPGARYEAPPAYTFTLWAPLFSADDDTVPDELQAVGPLWAELVATLKDSASEAEREARLRSLGDPAKAARLRAIEHVSLESDYAYAAMQVAWMQSVELFRAIARDEKDPAAREALDHRARALREKALQGAAFSLRAVTQLRNRPDLMPAYGLADSYGFNVAVFDWAYRETCDARYRDAALRLADMIATSDRVGGLQVTDPEKPNYGGYIGNELSRDAGVSAVDDQGAKLWALRIAYERTGDPKYAASAELCIQHWIKTRPEDHLFYGSTRVFDRYATTRVEQGRTPYGHYFVMLGLRAWSDIDPRAQQLFDEGLRYATERHGVHSLGPAGVYAGVFPEEGAIDFTTKADLGGLFLWALTLRPESLRGPWRGTCAATSRVAVASSGREKPLFQ